MTTSSAWEITGSQSLYAGSGSLLAAVARLEDVIASAPAIDPWCAQRDAALRECTAAVRYHLETLDGDDGMRQHIAHEEPRLISRLQRLDDELKRLLPELRDARQSAVGLSKALVEPLSHLVVELRHADHDELELLYESLNPVGSGD